MFEWLRKKKVDKDEKTVEISVNPSENATNLYSADAPIDDPEKDLFKRWPFAKQIADIIASRNDPSSMVIGIYGAWGEGKTSVLNFIKQSLVKDSNEIVIIYFNPWLFKDETSLLRMFFGKLASSIEKSMLTKKEKIGQWLDQYGKVIAPLSLNLGPISIPGGDALKEIGSTLSSVDLEVLKSRIESFLTK